MAMTKYNNVGEATEEEVMLYVGVYTMLHQARPDPPRGHDPCSNFFTYHIYLKTIIIVCICGHCRLKVLSISCNCGSTRAVIP